MKCITKKIYIYNWKCFYYTLLTFSCKSSSPSSLNNIFFHSFQGSTFTYSFLFFLCKPCFLKCNLALSCIFLPFLNYLTYIQPFYLLLCNSLENSIIFLRRRSSPYPVYMLAGAHTHSLTFFFFFLENSEHLIVLVPTFVDWLFLVIYLLENMKGID